MLNCPIAISLHEVLLLGHAIKIKIRPCPVSIFGDIALSSQFLKSQGWLVYTGSSVLMKDYHYLNDYGQE